MARQKTENKIKTTKKNDPGKYDFLGKALPFGIMSGVLMLISLGLIVVKGLNYGIDFAGGTEVQVKFSQPIETNEIRSFVENLNIGNTSVQSFDDKSEYLIRFEVVKGATDKETNEKNNRNTWRLQNKSRNGKSGINQH